MKCTPHEAALADVLPLIDALELPYLESLQQLLAEHIETRRAERLEQARDRIAQIARNLGLTPEEILRQAHTPRCHTGKGQPKYRDPETGKTWSGLGTVPFWIRDRDRTQFLIGGQS